MADIAPRAPDRTADATQPQDAPSGAPRALKAAVIVMGVLLVFGFAVVIITIANRAANPESTATAEGGFGTVEVAAPPGARVVRTVLEGRRALVTLRDEAGRETLVVLDVIRGQEVGRFALDAGGP
jgi:hypothetical protein